MHEHYFYLWEKEKIFWNVFVYVSNMTKILVRKFFFITVIIEIVTYDKIAIQSVKLLWNLCEKC